MKLSEALEQWKLGKPMISPRGRRLKPGQPLPALTSEDMNTENWRYDTPLCPHCQGPTSPSGGTHWVQLCCLTKQCAAKGPLKESLTKAIEYWDPKVPCEDPKVPWRYDEPPKNGSWIIGIFIDTDEIRRGVIPPINCGGARFVRKAWDDGGGCREPDRNLLCWLPTPWKDEV